MRRHGLCGSRPRSADGRVLFSGSVGIRDPIADIYDPVADQWTKTEPMPYPMYNGSTTPLADGRVLIPGGYRDRTRFDFSRQPSSSTPRRATWAPDEQHDRAVRGTRSGSAHRRDGARGRARASSETSTCRRPTRGCERPKWSSHARGARRPRFSMERVLTTGGAENPAWIASVCLRVGRAIRSPHTMRSHTLSKRTCLPLLAAVLGGGMRRRLVGLAWQQPESHLRGCPECDLNSCPESHCHPLTGSDVDAARNPTTRARGRHDRGRTAGGRSGLRLGAVASWKRGRYRNSRRIDDRQRRRHDHCRARAPSRGSADQRHRLQRRQRVGHRPRSRTIPSSFTRHGRACRHRRHRQGQGRQPDRDRARHLGRQWSHDPRRRRAHRPGNEHDGYAHR